MLEKWPTIGIVPNKNLDFYGLNNILTFVVSL